jgi:hypothetical protein
MIAAVGRVLAVLTAVSLVGLAIGTGAFSATATDRTVSVTVAADDTASLALTAHDGPNGAFAGDRDRDGALDLSLDGTVIGSGDGPNPDAVTRLDGVFDVTNGGTQSVGVWLTDDADAVTFLAASGMDGHRTVEGRANAVMLAPGESVAVGVEIDARGAPEWTTLLTTVTIETDAGAMPSADRTVSS